MKTQLWMQGKGDDLRKSVLYNYSCFEPSHSLYFSCLMTAFSKLRDHEGSYSFLFFSFFFLSFTGITLTHTNHMSSCFIRKITVFRLMFNEAQQRSCTEPECSSYSPQSLQCIPNTAILLYDSYLGMSRSHLSSTPPYSFTHARTHSSNTY